MPRTSKHLMTHGEARKGKQSTEYIAWARMKSRCYYVKDNSYADYGGRGITVCDRWRNSYENFLADMGRRPSKKHSLDRIENDKEYSPSNCRWATKQEQLNNTRKNHYIVYKGEKLTLSQVSALVGVTRARLCHHLKKSNGDIDAAISSCKTITN